MSIFLRKLFLGYIPFTVSGILIVYLIISASNSWAAALAGGVFFVLWSCSVAVSQVLIFVLKYESGFYIKCIIVTFISLIASPFIFGALYQLATILIKGKPDFEKDLSLETSICKIEKIKKEKRMGGSTYYAEANLKCSSQSEPYSVTWWYSYNEKQDTWSRSPSKNIPK